MWDILKNKYVVIALCIIIFLVVLGWYFYSQGKKTVTLQQLPGQVPGEINSGNVNGASNDEIKLLVNKLYSDMKGFNAFGHDYSPYREVGLLNDADVIRVYNAFNTLYQPDSGQTLTQWIASEKYRDENYPGLLYARLMKLNCK